MSTGCARSGVDPGAENPAGAVEFRSSGRTISGVFAQKQPAAGVTITFTADGDWTRVESSATGSRTTGGSYLIDDAGHLVSYVERVGDGRLTTAEEHVIDIGGDLVSGFVLTARDGSVTSFERIGDAPPVAPG